MTISVNTMKVTDLISKIVLEIISEEMIEELSKLEVEFLIAIFNLIDNKSDDNSILYLNRIGVLVSDEWAQLKQRVALRIIK